MAKQQQTVSEQWKPSWCRVILDSVKTFVKASIRHRRIPETLFIWKCEYWNSTARVGYVWNWKIKFHTILNITSCQAGRSYSPNCDGCQDPKTMNKVDVLTTEIAFKMGRSALFQGRQELQEFVNFLSPPNFPNFKYGKFIIYFSIN